MSIDVVWLSYDLDVPVRGYWDQGLIEDLLNSRMWGQTAFRHHAVIEDDPDSNWWTSDVDGGAIVVFPARRQIEHAQRLNRDLKELKWVVLIVVGDEDNSFPLDEIHHPNMRKWVMTPRPDKHGDDVRKLGSGYPPQARELLKKSEHLVRPWDWSFAGQITHDRRQQCLKHMLTMRDRPGLQKGRIVASESFTAGLPPPDYYKLMAMSKAVLCPSGPESPDTFRLFEALEAGCVPVADSVSPRDDWDVSWKWWTYLFGAEPPFPAFDRYDQLTGYTEAAVLGFPALNNKVFAWWQAVKRNIFWQLLADLNELSPGSVTIERITVLIPTSPIPSHPSTEMIEQTINDIREVLPSAEILIMCDGIRPEQEHRRDAYEQYKQRLLWLCNYEWHNVLPIVYEEHLHQAELTRRTLDYVRSPLILFVEHDTPLTPDFDFDWDAFGESIFSGEANVIRFYHEANVIPSHENLMLSEPVDVNGLLMRRTSQWSQRPHLSSVVFYRWMLDTYFNPNSRTMIEDEMHGVIQDACVEGILGWYRFRVWLYTPKGDNIKRSYNLDGRQDDPKYDMYVVPVK